jgi:hypothetical protein
MPLMNFRLLVVVSSLCALVPAELPAQGLPPGTNVTSASLSGVAQFDTDFDRGGSFHWAGGRAAASMLHQFTPQFAAGASASYEYQDWNFSDPVAFAGTAPWKNINRPRLAATLLYAPGDGWSIGFIPSVGWSYENGAATGDAVEYGAVVTAAKTFYPGLTLGLGAAVFRQIYETKVFPFPVIQWQIDDRWKLTNPFEGGPAGGAGLELTYGINDQWDVGAGGSYRSYVFRLSQDGPVGNGIGQNNFVPLFFRASYHFGKQTQVDLYAAALTGGKLTVKNASGNDLSNDSYKTAPALGLSLQTRF